MASKPNPEANPGDEFHRLLALLFNLPARPARHRLGTGFGRRSGRAGYCRSSRSSRIATDSSVPRPAELVAVLRAQLRKRLSLDGGCEELLDRAARADLVAAHGLNDGGGAFAVDFGGRLHEA